jgi:3',5'-cyclic AMP phosphodiesterase CpdA
MASNPLARIAPVVAPPALMAAQGHETRQLNEPAFTMIFRGHQCVDAIPAAEAQGLKTGSVLLLKNARGLSANMRGGPPAVRTLEARLAKDPEEFANIDALLAKHPYRNVFPVATSAVSAAQHYRSVFSRNADLPVVLLHFKKDPDLVAAP